MIEEKDAEFQEAINHLKTELGKLRTGRANPALVESLAVDHYGQKMQVNQLANLSVPEPRQILIQPWDKNAVASIEKAIRESDLGLNPTNEGDKLRITLPELTQERRQELAKVVNKMAEDCRIRIRNVREELAKKIKSDEKAGNITEDDRETMLKKLQEKIDDYNDQIKEMSEAKEKEVLTV